MLASNVNCPFFVCDHCSPRLARMFSLFSSSTNSLPLLLLCCLCCFFSICNAQPCAVFFVSSRKQDGDFGNVRAADALCTRLFEMNGKMTYKNAKSQLGITFNFTAWLSTRSSHVIDRIGPFTAGCVENVNGDVLAMSIDLFRRNTLQRAPNINELGSSLDDKVFTGSTSNGSYIAGDGNSCMNWTSNSSSSKAVYGESAEKDQWSNKDSSTDSCEKEYPIYCFGVPIVTAVTASTSTTTTPAITTPAPTVPPTTTTTTSVGRTTTMLTTTTTAATTTTTPGSSVASSTRSTMSQTQSQPTSTAVSSSTSSSSSSSSLSSTISLSVITTVASLDNSSRGSAGSDSVDTSDVAVVTSQSDAQPTSDSNDWWIYVIIVIVVLLVLGLIVAWVGWRRRRARDSDAEPARALDDAGDNDNVSRAHAMTSEYASAASVLGGEQNANVSVYGKAPDMPEIIYDTGVGSAV
jgi:hypothetical protein